MYPRPWQEPDSAPPQTKNSDFYGKITTQNAKSNLWDNKHRTSRKVYNFYHNTHTQKQEEFISKDLDGKNRKQNRQLSQQFYMHNRTKSHERLYSRKIERKMLTFKSNQPGLDFQETQVLGDIMSNDCTQVIADDLAGKRSLIGAQKCPDKTKEPNQQLWDRNRINQAPTNRIKQLIQKKTLLKDQTACKEILKRIVQEKGVEELEKNWHLANRELLRQKFVDRHEENIKKEEKAGIKKDYVAVANLMHQKRFSNTERLVDFNAFSNRGVDEEFIYSINQPNSQPSEKVIPQVQHLNQKSDKVSTMTANRDIGRSQISKPGAAENQEFMRGPRNLNQQSATQTAMGNSKSSHTLNGAHAKKTMFSTVDKGQSTEHLQIADESPIGQEQLDNEKNTGQVITFRDQTPEMGGTEMNFDDEQATGQMFSGKRGDGRTLYSEEFQFSGFRVRSQVARKGTAITKNYRLRKQVERLSVPKVEYIPQDPYKYQDFRGLLCADFKEALTNAFDQETLDRINFEEPTSPDEQPSQETQVLIDKIKSSLEQSPKNTASFAVSGMVTADGNLKIVNGSEEFLSTRKSSIKRQAFPVPKSTANLLSMSNTRQGSVMKKRGSSMANVPEYKSLSILAAQDPAQQFLKAAGQEGTQLWEQLNETNFNRTQSMVDGTKPSTANTGKRPMTAYYNSIEGGGYTFSKPKNRGNVSGATSIIRKDVVGFEKGTQSKTLRGPKQVRQMREAAHAMDEIKSFEQRHQLTKLGRPENKYPHVQLEAHYAMGRKFFSGQDQYNNYIEADQ